ncbi:MAG: hypothetical protein IKB96_02255, partial [Prevotella sp.]|nr:hypothetical protein [Prevotella sp.]
HIASGQMETSGARCQRSLHSGGDVAAHVGEGEDAGGAVGVDEFGGDGVLSHCLFPFVRWLLTYNYEV